MALESQAQLEMAARAQRWQAIGGRPGLVLPEATWMEPLWGR
jgi:hypothetical protein